MRLFKVKAHHAPVSINGEATMGLLDGFVRLFRRNRKEDKMRPEKRNTRHGMPVLGDKYEMHGVVGLGGFGTVYLVYSRETGAVHALKTYHDEFYGVTEVEDAFRKEAQIWVDLERHPNLVRALFVEKIRDRLYLGMEYVAPDESGKNNLQDYLGSNSLDAEQALLWSIQICHGMEYAYEKGILCHRDLKPANILITLDLRAKVSDFGLAKICDITSSFAESAGTPAYMAPEQFLTPSSCDQKSDIYSFGVILFQMLQGGDLPFSVDSGKTESNRRFYWDAFRRHHMESPVPSIDSPAAKIVCRCLEKAPDNRYHTFADLRRDLELVLRNELDLEFSPPPSFTLDAYDLCNKGMSLHNLGKYAQALECCKRALDLAPDLTMAWSNQGDTLLELGQYEDALQCYFQVTKMEPSLGWNKQGLLYLHLEKPDKAESCFRSAIEANTNYAAVHAMLNLGEALRRLGKLDEAICCFDKAIHSEPCSFAPWFNMGLVLYQKKEFSLALEIFEESLRHNSTDIDAITMKAMSLRCLARYDDAINLLNSLLGKGTDSSVIRLELGNNFALSGDYKRANIHLKAAVKLDPETAVSWYCLAQAQEAIGDDGAFSSYSTYIEKAGASEPVSNIEFAKRKLSVLRQRGNKGRQ